MIVLMPLFRASLKCVACVCDNACFLQSLCQSLWFATINEDRFGSRPENIQFGESADVSSPNFVKRLPPVNYEPLHNKIYSPLRSQFVIHLTRGDYDYKSGCYAYTLFCLK